MGKMIYYTTLISIVMLYFLSIGGLVRDINTKNIEDLTDIFDIGCTWLYMDIHAWGNLDMGDLSSSELEKVLCDGAEELFFCDYWDISEVDHCKTKSIAVNGQSDNGQIITITGNNSVFGVADIQYDTYIIVDIVDIIPWQNWKDNLDRVNTYFNDRDCSPIISCNLIGYYNGKLDSGERKIKCIDVLKKLGATHIETMESDGLISMTGFTANIKGVAKTSRGSVNINVASRYNLYEDRTYIVIGTPVITIEY